MDERIVNLKSVEVLNAKIGRSYKLCVDARELHKALKIKTGFSTWIWRKVSDFKFDELEDYWAFHEKPPIGRPYWVIYITLNMAKEICITERSTVGKELRRELLVNTTTTYSGKLTNIKLGNNYEHKKITHPN